jgi:predicted nucleic acid-binding protein
MARISLVELSPVVLARALEAFPMPLRTLDALHLATVEFLRSRGRDVALASYDERLLAVARSLAIPLFDA